MKTILGTEIPTNIKGVLYLCEFDGTSLEVKREILFESSFDALECYANIPNPESQLATGKTYDILSYELNCLHRNMKDPEWLKELENYL